MSDKTNKTVDYSKLQKTIAYQFKDQNLLVQALSHKSFNFSNNERLEFLGDSILNFVIAEYLYQHFRASPEGELTRIRAALVRGETLAKIAQEIKLQNYLLLGAGELKSGGFNRPSILADAVEAIIGAVLLDSEFASAQAFILNLYRELLEADDLLKLEKDPKTQLQEYLQGRKCELPIYEVVSISGEAHQQHFKMSCSVEGGEKVVFAEGSSRRKAEQEAAAMMLVYLQQN